MQLPIEQQPAYTPGAEIYVLCYFAGMLIVADEQIPLIDILFEDFHLIKKPGTEITRQDLTYADMLWVRTLTRVDSALLSGSAVRFVGTATAGFDHLDTEWLAKNGIAWGYAPGANSMAVAEYVLCVIAALRDNNMLPKKPLRAGIIGVGHVGSAVARSLQAIGFKVMENDPPRGQSDRHFYSTPLSEFKELDLICLHPALHYHEPFASYHMLDENFFRMQKNGTVLINASRGAVVDSDILLKQNHLNLCLDVWENEPDINIALLAKTTVATPHIAGYSVDAKRRASLLLYQQAQSLLKLPEKIKFKDYQHEPVNVADWESRALTVFNPITYTDKMKKYLIGNAKEIGQRFLELRKQYPWRESFFSSSR